MVTSLCNRNCKYCCNKQYDLNSIPYVTDEELSNAHTILLTGGEPFAFTDPPEIAKYYKTRYPNIKNIYVYANALDLALYLSRTKDSLASIDGITVSIKDVRDRDSFKRIINDNRIKKLQSNWLFVFNDLVPEKPGNFTIIKRKWQEKFVPDSNSIFRKA